MSAHTAPPVFTWAQRGDVVEVAPIVHGGAELTVEHDGVLVVVELDRGMAGLLAEALADMYGIGETPW